MDGDTKLPGLRTFHADIARAQGVTKKVPEAPAPEIPLRAEAEPQQRAVPAAALQKEEPIPKRPERPAASFIPPKKAAAPEVSAVPKAAQGEVKLPTLEDDAPSMPLPAAEPVHPHAARQNLTLEEMDEAALPAFKMTTGSIIRETKRERFKLLPSMVTATKTWAEDISKNYNERRHPRHEVMQAEVRKHTIEAASREAEIAPKDDFTIVAQRLKNAPRQKVTTGITFSKKQEVPAPQWTHLQEEEDARQQGIASEAAPAAPKEEESADAVTIPYEEAVTPQPITEPEPVAAAEEIEPQPISAPEIMESRIPEDEAAEERPESVEAAQPSQVPEPLSEERSPYRTPITVKSATAQSSARERGFPVLFFGGVVALAVVLGIGVSLVFFLQRPQSTGIVEQNAAAEPPHLLNAQDVQGAPLPATREALLSLLGNESTGGGVSVLYFTDEAGNVASAADVLSVLAAQTDGSFSRNVTDLVFGSTDGQPFLLLKTKDFDTAFAGILGWERSLSGDLAPLFGVPVVSSFDPTARTDTQLREAFFKDEIVSNKNARVLLDEKGKERIVYAFVDRNTLVITTTPAAFASLVPLVR
jgi:hypothetical protein